MCFASTPRKFQTRWELEQTVTPQKHKEVKERKKEEVALHLWSPQKSKGTPPTLAGQYMYTTVSNIEKYTVL